MNNNRDGIWIIGADAQTTYANERMAEILGTSPSEMVGRASFTYVFPEDVDAAQRLFEAKTRGDAKPFAASLTVAAQDSRPSRSLLLSCEALILYFMPVYPGALTPPLHQRCRY